LVGAKAEWDKMLEVSAKGTWICSKAVFPQMKKQNKGKIINISSEAAFAPTKGLIHYTAAKAAVIGITRVLAGELGQYNICVNVVVPGVIDRWTPAPSPWGASANRRTWSVPLSSSPAMIATLSAVKPCWSMAPEGSTKIFAL
jgi:NAD(P)-dependent dehydrogenase (short-subunit alcohol dehydrogenase family)